MKEELRVMRKKGKEFSTNATELEKAQKWAERTHVDLLTTVRNEHEAASKDWFGSDKEM